MRRNAARLLPTVPTVLLPHVRRRRLTNPAPRLTSPVSPPPASVLVSSRLRLCGFHTPRLALEPASLDVQILDIPVSCSHGYGSPITDVHSEGGVMSKVDVGSGYLSYIGRPQTLPFWITIATFCCPATWLRNGPKSPPFYCTTNLVLHSNFDIYMFYLLIYR